MLVVQVRSQPEVVAVQELLAELQTVVRVLPLRLLAPQLLEQVEVAVAAMVVNLQAQVVQVVVVLAVLMHQE
jgi:hypothetical protein